MPTNPLADDILVEAALAYRAHNDNKTHAAASLGIPRGTFVNRLERAAERGLLGPQETLPGFAITQVTDTPNGQYVRQRKEHGEEWQPTDGLAIKGKTSLLDAEGRIITQHVMERAGDADALTAMRAAVDALKEELPRLQPLAAPAIMLPESIDLANQFTVTDNHFGMLSWGEETGSDYDLRIAEELLMDWFAAAVRTSPDGDTAILAQLGDLLHHDGMDSVTPTSKHVLDADSRLQKIIRVVIRCFRKIVDMLLGTHQRVHVVMASGNHDPASSAWLREMFATIYENEPRVSVDTSPSLYYAFEWGKTGLYYHHMHKRGVKDLDRVFAGLFREMFGRCEFNYGHGGHLHSDAIVSTQLMYIERHETLAARDAYAAGGGWLSGRSAKRISYSRRFGEVGRATLRPEMVAGASLVPVAANDNGEKGRVAA